MLNFNLLKILYIYIFFIYFFEIWNIRLQISELKYDYYIGIYYKIKIYKMKFGNKGITRII